MDITTIEFRKFILFEITKIPVEDNAEKKICFLEVKIAKLKKDSEKQYSDEDFDISDIEFIPLKTAKTYFDILFADKIKLGFPLDQKTVLKYVAELYTKDFLKKSDYSNKLFKNENEISNDLIENFLNKKENEDKPVRFKISDFPLDDKDIEPLEGYVKNHRNVIEKALMTKLYFEREYKEMNIVLSDIDLNLFYKTLSFRTPIDSSFEVLEDKNNKERAFVIVKFELIVNKEKLKNIMKNNLGHLSNDEFEVKHKTTFDLFKKFNEGLFKWLLTHYLQMYRFGNKLDLSSLGLLCDTTTQKSDSLLFQIVNKIFFGDKDKISKYSNKFIFLCEAKVLVFMPYIFNKAIKEALIDFASKENSKSQKLLKDFAEQEHLNLPLNLEAEKYNEDLFNELDDIKSVIEIFSESNIKEIYNEIIENNKIKYDKCYPHLPNELPCEGNYNELSNVFSSHNIKDIIKNDLKYVIEVEKKDNDEVFKEIQKSHTQGFNNNSNTLSSEVNVMANTQEEQKKDDFAGEINVIANTQEDFSLLERDDLIARVKQEGEKVLQQNQANDSTFKIYTDKLIKEEPFGDFEADKIEEVDNIEEEPFGDFEADKIEELNSAEGFISNQYDEAIKHDERTEDLAYGYSIQEEIEVLKRQLIEKDRFIEDLKKQIKLLESDEQIKNIEDNYLKLSDGLRTEIKNKNTDIKNLRHQLAEKNLNLENIKQELENAKCEIEEIKSLSNNNSENTVIPFVNFSELYFNIPLNTNEYNKTILLLSLLSCASNSDAEILNNYIDFALEKNNLDINRLTEEYSNFLRKLDIEDKRGLERALKTTKSDVRAGLLSMLDFFKDCFEYHEVGIKAGQTKQTSKAMQKKNTLEISKDNTVSEKKQNGLINKILSKFDFKNKNKKISDGKHISLIFDVLVDKPYYSKNISSAVLEEVSSIITNILTANKTTFQNLSVNSPLLKEQKEEEIRKKAFITLKYEILIVIYEDKLVYEKFNNIFQRELKKLRFEAVFVESIFHS